MPPLWRYAYGCCKFRPLFQDRHILIEPNHSLLPVAPVDINDRLGHAYRLWGNFWNNIDLDHMIGRRNQ